MSDEIQEPFEGKKLFEVEIEKRIFVLAGDRREAEAIAEEEAGCGGQLEWDNADFFAHEAAGPVPNDWANAIPFGGHKGDPTCAQVIAAWEEYESTRPATRAELEAAGQMKLGVSV